MKIIIVHSVQNVYTIDSIDFMYIPFIGFITIFYIRLLLVYKKTTFFYNKHTHCNNYKCLQILMA